ncbi:MAG: cobalamin biosynthesis protein CobD [Chloroflexi bacterium]|nr:cobalamin biosynthesis protein CobD [Chloroflexota bacterium]
MIPFLALLIDHLFGDPPNRFHPVAWMGRFLAWGMDRAPREGRARPFLAGAALTLGGALLSGLAGYAWARAAQRLPRPLNWLLQAIALKSALSLRGLTDAAAEVETALEEDDLPQARERLAWHLVSRDAARLDASQVAAAAVESVAENASDGVIAPLFYYALGGLPAALAYRFVNTADAMLGYRDAQREWLGKAPARLDDALNWIPARITAALIVVAAWVAGEDARSARRTWRRDARLTASPNAGHPMSAMAGALRVRLEKVGHYRLGAEYPPPHPTAIDRASRLARVASWTVSFLLLFIAHGRFTRSNLPSKTS